MYLKKRVKIFLKGRGSSQRKTRFVCTLSLWERRFLEHKLETKKMNQGIMKIKKANEETDRFMARIDELMSRKRKQEEELKRERYRNVKRCVDMAMPFLDDRKQEAALALAFAFREYEQWAMGKLDV